MKLIYIYSGEEVQAGDRVLLENGEYIHVADFIKPEQGNLEGRVVVRRSNDTLHPRYVSEIGAVWIEREDRGELPLHKVVTLEVTAAKKKMDFEKVIRETYMIWRSPGGFRYEIYNRCYLKISDDTQTAKEVMRQKNKIGTWEGYKSPKDNQPGNAVWFEEP